MRRLLRPYKLFLRAMLKASSSMSDSVYDPYGNRYISVLAYHLLNAIEHRLHQYGDHRSWGTLRKTLSTHQRLTIEYQEKTQTGSQRHHVRLCSQAEVEHKIIYPRLGLHPVPLPRKRYVGK